MSHRSSCNRAFSYAPILAVVAMVGVAVLALRENPTWNGVGMNVSRAQVIAQLGQPRDMFTVGSITNLQYPGMEVWLRNDRVYCLTMQGDHESLCMESFLRFGLPMGSWGDCRDWHYGDVVARVCNDRLIIFALNVP